ncbi:MAG: radical SAM protein [Gemmatimonadota bacterium]|nr:radical SAM protein [Gemmatimonadota bacterium]
MLSSRFHWYHVPAFAAKYAYLHLKRFPILVHFEVTERCNARCTFCDYWKTPADAKLHELASFADAARFFNPLMITFTGGEPTLRRDLEELIAAVSAAVRLKYICMITHGGTLTAERARSLWDAGLNQFNISLDYPDERHDRARGIPGLSAKIFRTVSAMRERGIDAIRFNTVIKRDNLDDILPIVEAARELGIGVGFSAYTSMKNGNDEHYVADDSLGRLDALVSELLAYKRAHPGVITSSDHYLRNVPKYYRGELDPECRAGVRTIHVNPTGHVRRCPDFPSDAHWTEFERYEPIECSKCYYACRGEAQAPLNLARVRDYTA